ncbi:DUF3048 domain-containing protein [Bacillus sp. FJAT-47783]|uniref:DUF3048 domain-containing protein n=1 Tax=Bacillus sp. FJAT-47783 TaxID=2922712 RepID=UPI001FAD9930|nr:DUF3048 domain-containing protein [Bacillus sp. FJAT-47783]
MKRLLFSAVIVALSITSACSNSVEQSNSDYEQEVRSEESKEEAAFLHPLTGLPSKVKVDTRPYAVMVNNHPKARPQSGLHQADIVYELLAEGHVTRFLAIFQSEQPEVIGPVRSARDYYIDLSKGYDALYVSHGWSPSAKEKLTSGEADYLNGLFYDGTLFWRDDTRKAPHNSYISFANMEKGAEKKGYSTTEEVPPIPFAKENVNDSGSAMPEFTVQYDDSPTWTIQYEYDDELARYKRYSGDELTVDRDTKDPVLISNIFVVEMEHKIIDNYGRRNIDVYTGGNGYLFQHGQMREVEWKNIDGRILPYENGDPVPFVPGRTWINVVPDLNKMLRLP